MNNNTKTKFPNLCSKVFQFSSLYLFSLLFLSTSQVSPSLSFSISLSLLIIVNQRRAAAKGMRPVSACDCVYACEYASVYGVRDVTRVGARKWRMM